MRQFCRHVKVKWIIYTALVHVLHLDLFFSGPFSEHDIIPALWNSGAPKHPDVKSPKTAVFSELIGFSVNNIKRVLLQTTCTQGCQNIITTYTFVRLKSCFQEVPNHCLCKVSVETMNCSVMYVFTRTHTFMFPLVFSSFCYDQNKGFGFPPKFWK